MLGQGTHSISPEWSRLHESWVHICYKEVCHHVTSASQLGWYANSSSLPHVTKVVLDEKRPIFGYKFLLVLGRGDLEEKRKLDKREVRYKVGPLHLWTHLTGTTTHTRCPSLTKEDRETSEVKCFRQGHALTVAKVRYANPSISDSREFLCPWHCSVKKFHPAYNVLVLELSRV